jgi:hypothetical protein
MLLSAFAFLIGGHPASPAAVASARNPPATLPGDQVNLVSLSGRSNIQDQAHCGICNGMLAPGIPFQRLAEVDGLWAPPYVSSDFRLQVRILDQDLPTERYTWWPFKVERCSEVKGLRISTATVLAAGRRAGILSVTVENPTLETREVSLGCLVAGTLDRCDDWGFGAPVSTSRATPVVAGGTFLLRHTNLTIAIRPVPAITWEAAASSGTTQMQLKPNDRATQYFVFAIDRDAEAELVSQTLANDPADTIRQATDDHRRQIHDLFDKLPRLESANLSLVHWYNRSLVHFLMNRWDVPEFALHPFYGTGSVRGGCVCSYLWNFGEAWEILPLYDPAADRQHIRQYLRNGMMDSFALEPISGKAFGPWYPVNQEKLIGLVYYYVKNTGDKLFLAERVNDKTILQQVMDQAACRDDWTKPVALVDYGPSNSHLELRRGYPYNHVMPDLNGRRYANYLMAARLADVAGQPDPRLRARAADLKNLLKTQLWRTDQRWFAFITPKGRDVRWTNQMFKLFGSGVLDPETESGLLSHLNEQEFLSPYGLHSLSKLDVAYDPVDIDNGGPGSCTSFPPQIAERLCKAGHDKAAQDLIRRLLWWGERLPYWGDSIVADQMDYRKDTPLQCAFDSVAAAQFVIFGLFRIEARFDGTVLVSPHTSIFPGPAELRRVRLRGTAFDVSVQPGQFEVRLQTGSLKAPPGAAILLNGDKLTISPKPPIAEL